MINLFILLPQRIALLFPWAGPLFARIVVGYTFMLSGWGKLNNLPAITENFISWGIPYPHILTPFVSGVEFFGGIFLILGLLTRLTGGALSVVMLVAILSAKLADVNTLEDLLGFEETAYLALFFWLAVAGAGKVSLDYVLERRFSKPSELSE
ncbi:MAG: DoxX family protein [Pseudomonadota bacterium]